jgi:uncharacterized membrane protein YeaQ/YmgE (transglycosylase-associated protein family)
MSFLGWIILGAIAGAIAKKIMPGRDPGGLLVSIAIGVAGGILGGGVSSLLFDVSMGSFFDIRSWIIAILGAVALLAVFRFIKAKFLTEDPPKTGDHSKVK